MARSRSVIVLAFVFLAAACGGGGDTGRVSPPSPADFSIGLSSATVAVTQGSASAPVDVSITPQNNFSGTVQVSFSGLPSGVTTNPTSPFPVAAGQSVSVLFGADSDAATGQFDLTAQATSGTLSHSHDFSLSIQAAAQTNLPRTSFVQNDSVPLEDSPVGEPHHRHIVFDSANQRFFVANRALNRVEVFTATNPVLQSTISVPGASSVDLSTDGTTLWVGTSLEQIAAIDTATLRVKARYPISALASTPGVVFSRPVEVLTLSGGEMLVRLRQSASSQALAALWDPASNTLANLTSVAPTVFQDGLGVMARSDDHSRILAAVNDSSGVIAVLDGRGALIAGPLSPLAGTISSAAANANGSQFAIAVNTGGATQVLLLDSGLNKLGAYTSRGPAGIVFSHDGQFLYVNEPYGNACAVSVFSTSTMQNVGQVSDVLLQGVPTSIEEVGASSNLVGLNNHGVAFLDASQPISLPLPAPVFSAVPVAQPAEGPNAGGTTVSLAGANFTPNVQVRFGSGAPVNATVVSGSQIQIVSPPKTTSGPVNVTAYFDNGWVAIAPAAFTFGAGIVQVLPNTGVTQGGDTLTVYGYGFGSSASGISATIGGNAATVQTVDVLPAFASSLGLDATYPFALERIVLKTPAGGSGKADVTVQSSAGSATAKNAFQYLKSGKIYTNSGLYKFITYDQSRQKLFLAATDHVDVFDLNAGVFVSPIQLPPSGPPPSAALRGLALTPDASQLVVADFGAQSIYLVDPDGPTYNGKTVLVGGVSGFLNSGPTRVTATSNGFVFVGLSGEGGSGACNECLGQLNLLASPLAFQRASQPQVNSLTGAPLVQADANGDVVFLAYDTAPGGPVALWNAATPDTFSLSPTTDTVTDLATAADGTTFVVRANNVTGLRAANLSLVSAPTSADLETVPNRVVTPGIALHPTGALIYEPFLDGAAPAAPPATGVRGGIDVRDAHSGQLRLRIYLPEALAMLNTDVDGLHGSFLATDENGQRLFALTTSGLTVVQLAAVPLGIGTLSPSAGAASGGTTVTVRGSGFQNGIKAALGGKSATITWKDINTLVLTAPSLPAGPQPLVLTNPDGESVSLDAAFVVQ